MRLKTQMGWSDFKAYKQKVKDSHYSYLSAFMTRMRLGPNARI
jgi:hypothetical protein